MRPDVMLVVLAGAALWPIVAPLLGTGTAVAVIGGAMGLLKGPGEEFISDFLKRVAERERGGTKSSRSELQEEFERELLRRLEARDEEAAGLREDVSRLLQTVGGVEVALEAAVGDVKEALARGLAELGGTWGEFRWMLADVRVVLHAIQARQAEGLALQREQLDLLHEQLVKTNLLIVQERRPKQPVVGEHVLPEEEPADVACPYKGLEAFQPDDASYFFGREELVADVLARLAASPFLAVVGASGSGKSSLLRAGLVPALWAGALPGSKHWLVRMMTPGESPLRELAMRVSLLRGLAAGSLLADLRADPRHLGLAVRQALLDAPEDGRLLLVVDQLEELFTLCRDEHERRLFLEALIDAVAEPSSRAALTIAVRADFYGRLAAYPGFAGAVGDNQVLVGPMSAQELTRAIELPASVAGLSLEPGLADAMVHDLAGEPGALPLLSHALLETWKRRRGRTLTLGGYLESGGVRDAIARTADRVFAERLSPAQQAIARQIFFRLTEPGEGTEDTRRRATIEELVPRPEETSAVEAVVNVLVGERLVTTSEGSVEVAHEALIRHWPTLRGWLDEDRAALRIHRRLTEAAEEWERLARDEGSVFRGLRLAEAVAWLEQHSASANERERAFLGASVAAREHDRRRRRTRVVLVVTLLVIGLLAASVALVTLRQRAAEARIAESRAIAASAEIEVPLDPQVGLLLAIEAAHKARTNEATAALRRALLELRERVTIPEAAQAVAVSRDGGTLMIYGTGNDAAIWDARTGRRRATIASGGLAWAALSPTGRLVATVDDSSSSSVWTSEGRRLAQQHGDSRAPSPEFAVGEAPFSPDVATFSENGRYVLSVSLEGVRVFAIAGSRKVYPAPAGLRVPVGVPGFSRDGRFAMVGDSNQLFSVTTGEAVSLFRAATVNQGGFASPVFSPDGSSLLTTDDRGVHVLATPEWRAVPVNAGATQVLAVAVSHNHLTAAAKDGTGAARIWQAAVGTLGSDAPRPAGPRFQAANVALTPDGEYAAALTPASGLDVWRVSPWQLVARLPQVVGGFEPSYPPQIVIAPGAQLVGVFNDGEALIWNVSTGKLLAHRSESSGGSGDSLTLSQDGRLVASTDPQGAKVWEAHTGRLVSSLHTGAVLAPVAFNRAGTRVLTVSNDRTARVWDARSGKALAVLIGHADTVTTGAFSADDRFIVTASDDGSVRVWEADTGREVATLPVHVPVPASQGTIVAFSSPGPTVVVAANGAVHAVLCEVCRPFGELLKLAERRALRALTPEERHEFLHE